MRKCVNIDTNGAFSVGIMRDDAGVFIIIILFAAHFNKPVTYLVIFRTELSVHTETESRPFQISRVEECV